MRTLVAAIVLAMLLAACRYGPPVDTAPPVVGVVHVVVRDEQDRPLAGASVNGPQLEATTTDRTGAALVRAYAPTTSVAVQLSGYEDVVVPQVSVAQTTPVQVVLKRRH